MISVIADINGQNVSISTHPKKLEKIIKGIKNTADLVYEKPISGRTAGNDHKVLVISGDTQLIKNIPQITPHVKGKNKKKE